MIYVDQTFDSPMANLSADALLLERCETTGDEFLRCWSPPTRFVAIGRGNQADSEVKLRACRQSDIPVLRRISGGGAVVLGPGCLCYSLVFRVESAGELLTAKSANDWILRRSLQAIGLAGGGALRIEGDSDLASAGKKIGGHAQKRGRNAVLFHGCLLLDFELDWIGRCLRLPTRMPTYRAGRSHGEFVGNLGLAEDAVKKALRNTWQAGRTVRLIGSEVLARARTDYSRPHWLIAPEGDHAFPDGVRNLNIA